ncbi:glycoside hydrolase family 20 protein [Postia placenta MAD-698-R-SB12]|uniref:Beta-hexosaminidase n=1 Tax=Postia placenta MAD-698-R-SB12 TaxID=670580 RepID=A0A1X6MLC4_9APHY|nr:glycoside hydrolase family 20 protein [Postia placenta MAD-698-R-SB12]OSX57231.1 glycoside hydrolase family 20 protein [Postia placenta MAD-698-R-SB12]
MFRKAVLVAGFLAVVSRVDALWPLPTTLSEGTSALRLSYGFHIAVSPSVGFPPLDLTEAIVQTQTYLLTDDLGRLVVGRGASDVSAFETAAYLSELTLTLKPGSEVNSITTEAQKPIEERDEAYTLSVPANGSAAVIEATSTLGLFRGLTTFSQLWYTYEGTIYAVNTPVEIDDTPAYPYRGLLLDTARNYFPVADILRTLDAMSWVKINEFHWHVVDSQSFPLEIPGYEELATYGAYGPGMVYTAADVENIVSYAGARGIDVLVEIDTPGHTAAIADAHPDYVACNDARPWADFANEPPAGQIRFATPDVASWTAGLFTAVSKMFPSSIVSTGGDEINQNCYEKDEPTMTILNATGEPFAEAFQNALNDFVGGTHSALKSAGKTPAVWEEMVLDFNLTLADDTLVLVWISSDDVKAVADKGFRIIHAASNYFYLDCGGGGWVGDYPAGDSWCDPFKTWQYSYTFDPLANLTSDQYHLIMGGQHNLWTEQSSASNLDPIVWPRAAASAELFWSGAGGNVTAALPRLHDASFRMQQRGVNSIPLQPLWCALRPFECDLTW